MVAEHSHQKRVVVIGGGIGGLTAAALLAHRGYDVITFDPGLNIGILVKVSEHKLSLQAL